MCNSGRFLLLSIQKVLVLEGNHNFHNVSSRCRCDHGLRVSLSAGDEDGEGEEGEDGPMKLQPFLAKAERSHLIVWQLQAAHN